MLRFTMILVVLVSLFALLALGCEDERPPYEMASPQPAFTVTSTLPLDQALNVPRKANIVFHFSRQIDETTVKQAVDFHRVKPEGGLTDVPAKVSAVGNNVYITPVAPLHPLSDFIVSVSDSVRSVTGETPELMDGQKTLAFSTGAFRAQNYARPEVIGVDPAPDAFLVPDSVTFHIYFSEPLDESRVRYGTTVKLQKADGELIAALALVRDSQIVIDPVADLDAAETYDLTVSGLSDRNGETMLNAYTAQYEVTDTDPRTIMPVIMCPTLGSKSTGECPGLSDPSKLTPSSFTGNPINSMVLDSTMLGNSIVYVSGRLVAEMGNPKINEGFVPLVIRKGQILYGRSIEARLGGQIGTGYETGDITITVLADANGIMAGSEFLFGVEGQEAALAFTLDAAMNTTDDDPSTNAMMAQALLGVQLVGTGYVSGGKLVMEASGFKQVNLQGEEVPVVMSIQMVTMDVADATIPADNAAPVLRSSTPEDFAMRVRLSERIVGNFDEPVDPASAYGNFYLQTLAGAKIAGSVKTLGSRVVFTPDLPLAPNTEYQIVASAGLADILGNAQTQSQSVRFRTGADEANEVEDNPPLLTTTSPGPYDYLGYPAHFPLLVCFNQLMDGNTIRPGETFRVIDLTDGNLPVRGTVYFRGTHFYFEPNALWNPGHHYRMLVSDQITNYDGLALDIDGDRVPGGTPEFNEVYIDFKAIEENGWVFLALKLDPIVDTDGSGYVEGNEVGTDINTFEMDFFLFHEPSYASGYMIAWLKGLEFTQYGVPYMDVIINDGTYLTATSVMASLTDPSNKGLFDPMGRITIDVTKTGSANIEEGSGGTANMDVKITTLFNMENEFFNDMINNNLTLNSTGAVSFSPDGRMVAEITGSVKVKAVFHVPILGWDIPLSIPTKLKLRAVGDAVTYF